MTDGVIIETLSDYINVLEAKFTQVNVTIGIYELY